MFRFVPGTMGQSQPGTIYHSYGSSRTTVWDNIRGETSSVSLRNSRIFHCMTSPIVSNILTQMIVKHGNGGQQRQDERLESLQHARKKEQIQTRWKDNVFKVGCP